MPVMTVVHLLILNQNPPRRRRNDEPKDGNFYPFSVYMYIGVWNIQGLVDPLKQAEIRNLVKANSLCCIGILETKVSSSLFPIISWALLPGWTWFANYEHSRRGRIWIGWNPLLVTFAASSFSSQAVHGYINCLSSDMRFSVAVVYAEHTFVLRRSLWLDIVQTSSGLADQPWLIAGDFNAIHDASDRIGSSTVWPPSFDEFGQCLAQAELDDLTYVGQRFTWSTSIGVNRKQRKIDQVLVNTHWSSVFSYSEASFLPPGVSNHSPMIIKIMTPPMTRKPFKFFNFWMSHPAFSELVAQIWDSHIDGTPMFILCRKLKLLKVRLKQLNKESFSDISSRTSEARNSLSVLQNALDQDPYNQSLAEQERCHLRIFADLRLQKESFYKQNSRIQWLKEEDLNTKYFHHSVNKRQLRNRIISVRDESGLLTTDPALIQQLFVAHFEGLLSATVPSPRPPIQEIRSVLQRTLSVDQVFALSQPVSDLEIHDTLFSLPTW